MGKCKVRDEWLKRVDINGHAVSSWAEKQSDISLLCKLCSSAINVSFKGFQAIMQHCSSAKHKGKVCDALSANQLHFTAGSSSNQIGTSASPTICLYSVKDSAITAELIWCMKAVCSNYSAASCKDVADVFRAMFPGAVPEDFSLNSKKMRYLLTDALAPYFFQNMIEEAQLSYFTLSYDETSNVEDKKELLTTIRFWSEKKNEISTRHLSTMFIGHADANVLHAKINEAIQNANLPISKLLMIGSDGPNVNKKVNRFFNEDLLLVRGKGLIDIGTCHVHILHNAYRKALEVFGLDASDFLIFIYNYFDGWPSRWEDYEKLQTNLNLPSHKFMKHSSSRWLTLESAALRLLEQWEGIIAYFLKFLPQKKSKVMFGNLYKKIAAFLKNPTAKVEILFIVSSARLFTKFTGTFQKKEPLIHLMHTELKKLLLSLIGRVYQQCVLKHVSKDNYSFNDSVFSVGNLLPLKEIVNSAEVKVELSVLTQKDCLMFLSACQKHYRVACEYILERTSLSSPLLKALRCLQPRERILSRSCKDFLTVVKALPFDVPEDVALDEWKAVQLEEALQDGESERIDRYWYHFFSKKNCIGLPKYPIVTKVVKACLTLSHGAADLERSFSISRWALTEDKASMSERTLNSIMIVKDTLKNEYKMSPHRVPVTKKLLSLARCAHRSYVTYLEEVKLKAKQEKEEKEQAVYFKREQEEKQKELEKEQRELCLQKEKVEMLEMTLKQKKEEENIKRKTGHKLFIEAKERLKTALVKGDLQEARIVEAMLDGYERVQDEQDEKKAEVEKLQKEIGKRKSSLIVSFFPKKPKF